MFNEVVFLLLAFLTSIVSVTFGFGSALILIPFASLLLPIKKVIAVTTIFFIAGNLSKITLFKEHIDWRTTFLIWAGAFPMVLVGAYLMVYSPSDIIEKVLGIVILLYVINDYLKFTENVKLNSYAIAIVGGVYGFFGGIIGTGSAIKAALLTHIGLRKERFIATMATSAILLNIIKTVIYSKHALVSWSDAPLITGLILCAFAGNYAGRNIVKKIHPDVFKKIILLILVIVSIKLLL